MPEMHWQIQWPDGTQQSCYSPSSIIKDFFAPGEIFTMDEFQHRARTALHAASGRVQEKYGMPCARALGQLAQIEQTITRFTPMQDARITILAIQAL